MKTFDPPARGSHVVISRVGFDTVQRVEHSSPDLVTCSGGWRMVPTPLGWRWDADRDDRNPTTMRLAPHLDRRMQPQEA